MSCEESSYAYTSDAETNEAIESEVVEPINESNESEGEWEVLKENEDYEIFNKFPFPIRRKGSDKLITESIHKASGYYRCSLNGKVYKKHRLIALQFIPNPNPTKFKFVDHISRNRTDNRITNLRWVSRLQNNNNCSHQQFLQTIDKKIAIEVKNFNTWQFEDLWFFNDQFVRYNGINYTILNKWYNKTRDVYQTVVSDISGKKRTIYFNKFKREFGLIE